MAGCAALGYEPGPEAAGASEMLFFRILIAEVGRVLAARGVGVSVSRQCHMHRDAYGTAPDPHRLSRETGSLLLLNHQRRSPHALQVFACHPSGPTPPGGPALTVICSRLLPRCLLAARQDRQLRPVHRGEFFYEAPHSGPLPSSSIAVTLEEALYSIHLASTPLSQAKW